MIIRLSTSTAIVLSTLLILSEITPAVEAHSWAGCIKWKFNKPGVKRWGVKDGVCEGYARRFPLHMDKDKDLASLDSDSPSRHYQQEHGDPDRAMPCSDHKHGKDVGADETRADPVEDAYGGKYGQMTQTYVGDTLCFRWPAKNHAESNEDDTVVQINLSKTKDGKDPSQQELLKNKIAELPYKNCDKRESSDERPCGGCVKVPVRASGVYLLQWRWMLNPGEWYTSCADIRIGPAKDGSGDQSDSGNNDDGSKDGKDDKDDKDDKDEKDEKDKKDKKDSKKKTKKSRKHDDDDDDDEDEDDDDDDDDHHHRSHHGRHHSD